MILTIRTEKRLRIGFLSFFSVPGTALSLDDVKKSAKMYKLYM